MSEDFASSNLIPRALCEAVEGQKKGEREGERKRAREREGKTRGETTQ